MIILNRKNFLNLPDGICFAKYTKGDKNSCNWHEGLSIKVQTYRHDEDEVTEEGIPPGYYNGDPFDYGAMHLSNISSFKRDGLYEQDQLFAVFENSEIDIIIKHLSTAKEINNNLKT